MNTRIQIHLVTICFESGDMDSLVEIITLLSKKRSVVKQAVTLMVQKCMEFIDLCPSNNMEQRLALINNIRSVTEGKIYVEVERARVTRTLATMKEKEGKLQEASELMQEIQVETFGSMEKREKTEFILEQMRMAISIADFVKAQIISRKISPKLFESDSFEVFFKEFTF